jgi:hypothetical protein
MGICVAAAKLFGRLQPDDFRVPLRQRANFLNALMLERHQSHEFGRMAFCSTPTPGCAVL